MQVADADLSDRFDVQVDPTAEPVDIDRLVARFLIKLVRNGKSRTSSGTPAAGIEFQPGPEHGKGK